MSRHSLCAAVLLFVTAVVLGPDCMCLQSPQDHGCCKPPCDEHERACGHCESSVSASLGKPVVQDALAGSPVAAAPVPSLRAAPCVAAERTDVQANHRPPVRGVLALSCTLLI
jgi:hypothetical protein